MKHRTLIVALGLGALALAIGLAAGLILAWAVWPARYSGAGLADLSPAEKEAYIVLVGAAYEKECDLDRAQERLERLQAPNMAQWLAELAETYVADGRDPRETRYLVGLANAYGMASPALLAYVSTATPVPIPTLPPTPIPTDMAIPGAERSGTPLPTATSTPIPPPTDIPPTDTPLPPTATDTPKPQPTAAPATAKPKATAVPKPPTATPTPKPAAQPGVDFRVKEARLFTYDEGGCCANGLIQVRVYDVDGAPLDGILVHMLWSGQAGGSDPLPTGDKGPGITEHVMFGGGEQVQIAGHVDGRKFSSQTTRELRFRSPGPSYDELVGANCCGPLDRQMEWGECQTNPPFDCGGHWSYLVIFQATHRIRP